MDTPEPSDMSQLVRTVVNLRLTGRSVTEIATAQDLEPATVQDILDITLYAPTSTEDDSLDLRILERATGAIWTQAMMKDPDPESVNALVNIVNARSTVRKSLGHRTPTQALKSDMARLVVSLSHSPEDPPHDTDPDR